MFSLSPPSSSFLSRNINQTLSKKSKEFGGKIDTKDILNVKLILLQ
jgi:hypothetical protein